MSGIINKVKDALHHDKTDTTTTGTTGTTGTHATTAPGTHGSTNAGPHSSNLANSADPRVDSDLDHSRNAGLNQTTGTTGTSGLTGTTATGTTGLTGSSTTHGSTNAGPHNSNMLNKADPRVDSDLDRSRNAGMNQTTHTGGYDGTSHTTGGTGLTGGSGLTGTTHGATHGSTNAGPHSSNLMNTADPRVDSDLDGSRNAGMNQTTHPSSGLTGTSHSTTTHTGGLTNPTTTHTSSGATAGPHSSNMANKLDPRVDSDLDGSRNAGMNKTTTTGTGFGSTGHTGTTHTTTGAGLGSTTGSTTTGSSTTTGPHKSDMMNKMDPRVDSNLDGKKGLGS